MEGSLPPLPGLFLGQVSPRPTGNHAAIFVSGFAFGGPLKR
jgi:hypothetical protein